MYLSPNVQSRKKKSLFSPSRFQHDLFPTFIDPTHRMAAILVLQQKKLLPICCCSGCTIEGQQQSSGDESPQMSPQCCVPQEEKAGQGVAEHPLAAR